MLDTFARESRESAPDGGGAVFFPGVVCGSGKQELKIAEL
jgi:hypothetical protein